MSQPPLNWTEQCIMRIATRRNPQRWWWRTAEIRYLVGCVLFGIGLMLVAVHAVEPSPPWYAEPLATLGFVVGMEAIMSMLLRIIAKIRPHEATSPAAEEA